MATQRAWTQASLKARALVAQGLLPEVPAWLQVLERFGAFEPKKGKSPKQIHFSEDKLYQAYLANHPQFLQQPLDLNTEQMPAIKLFVMTQAALMEQGHSQQAAYRVVEDEFRSSASIQAVSAGQTTMTAAQQQEERLLQAALKQRRQEVGAPSGLSPPEPRQEAPPRAFSFRLPPKPQAVDAAALQSGISTSSEAAMSAQGQKASQPSAQSNQPSGSQVEQQQQQPANEVSSESRRQAPSAPAGFVPFSSDS